MIMSTCVDPKLLFHYSPNSAFDFAAAKRNCKNPKICSKICSKFAQNQNQSKNCSKICSKFAQCWTRTGHFWRLPFELPTKIVRIAAVGNRKERCSFRQNRGESDERHMDGRAKNLIEFDQSNEL